MLQNTAQQEPEPPEVTETSLYVHTQPHGLQAAWYMYSLDLHEGQAMQTKLSIRNGCSTFIVSNCKATTLCWSFRLFKNVAFQYAIYTIVP